MVSYHLLHFTLIEELQAIDYIEKGVSHHAICDKYSIIMRDVKICVHAHLKGLSNGAVRKQFGIAEIVIRRIVTNKKTWVQQVRYGIDLSYQRTPKLMYPMVDEKLTEFVYILRNYRIPVTLSLIQTRARQVAMELDIPQFKASRGYIKKYLRRSKERASFKLHGKGGNK